MVRNYQRMTPKPLWKSDDMITVLEKVRNKSMKIMEACIRCKIPKTCLLRRLKDESIPKNPCRGRYKPIFDVYQEHMLTEHILQKNAKGMYNHNVI